jgi:hypothetical protein
MKKVSVGKMALFDLLRRLVYPALDDHLDEVFPEFEFEKSPSGWWLAKSAPVNYRDYGHGQGKLAARSWGFRSLIPGKPAVFWLAYVNKQRFPQNNELKAAVQALAKKVKIIFEFELSEDELWEDQERIRRHLLLEGFLVQAQNELWTTEGKAARVFLVEKKGIPESKLIPLEFGIYTTGGHVKHGFNEVGFNGGLDHERVALTGLYQPHWEDRIVGPWRDIFGRRVFNVWGYRFPYAIEEEPVFEYLRRPGLDNPLGSKEVPLNLHRAMQNKTKHLVLVENPMSALVPYAKGLQNPCSIACGGELLEEQVSVLDKFLGNGGSLTLNFDYIPTSRGDTHAKTYEALDLLRDVSFPTYVVDPVVMGRACDSSDRVDPDAYIQAHGMKGYAELLKARVISGQFSPLAPEEDIGLFTL